MSSGKRGGAKKLGIKKNLGTTLGPRRPPNGNYGNFRIRGKGEKF